jgi:hypothetical protein
VVKTIAPLLKIAEIADTEYWYTNIGSEVRVVQV